MKIKTALIIYFLFTSFFGFSQSFEKILKWEVSTIDKGIVFGISDTKEQAELIIADFENRNVDSKYDIRNRLRKFTYSTIAVEEGEDNPLKKFTSLSPKGYKVLSAEDLRTLNIIKASTFHNGIEYYTNARKTDKDYATSRFIDITNNYSEYMSGNFFSVDW